MKTWGQIRSKVEFQVRHLKVDRNYSCPSFCQCKGDRLANALGGTGSMVHTALTFTSNPSMRNSIPDESEVSVVEYHCARSTLADRLRRKD